ncbi:hypothetical protein PENSTE_c001G06259 [Penicillium steckii]|uniref:Zn(2)-C6 fungal-type domain-containing protein n=1 Tax=Penicillium steckii TaxID=303698 RepID=A0A1V6TZ33_9EURO|nr:hypothetical protein PENSTE_c001G06259 [Penicillium steckii]
MSKMPSTNRRVSKGRSRNGCITCKIRRVKCDEQKPDCSKCLSTGRKCSGYSDHGDTPKGAQARFCIVQHVPGISQPTRLWQVPYSTDLLLEDEYRSLEFFQVHTTFCFGSGIGSYLLRAVYHEPILKTIAIALGSLHRSFAFSQDEPLDPEERTRFTLLRYNKAIRQLVSINPLTNPQSNDTFLIACILFFCFECLQGNYKLAFQHAISGLKIIKQERLITNVSSLGTYMPIEKITLLFSILENQVLEIESESIILSDLRPTVSSYFPRLTMGSSLLPTDSIEDIFISFQFLYNRFTRFLAICDPLIEPLENQSNEFLADIQSINIEYIQVRTEIEAWLSLFEDWLQRRSSSRKELESDQVIILKAWKLIIGIFIRLPLPPSELDWDHFTDDFSAVNSLVASMIGAPSSEVLSQPSSLPEPTEPNIDQSEKIPKGSLLPTILPKSSKSETSRFSLSLGVVTPLYLCATRCRESSVRYYSIRLMSYCQRREGLWDSDLAARIAKRIVTIEEMTAQISPTSEYFPADIGLACRVTSLSPAFDQTKRVKIRYNREGLGSGLIEEIFTW